MLDPPLVEKELGLRPVPLWTPSRRAPFDPTMMADGRKLGLRPSSLCPSSLRPSSLCPSSVRSSNLQSPCRLLCIARRSICRWPRQRARPPSSHLWFCVWAPSRCSPSNPSSPLSRRSPFDRVRARPLCPASAEPPSVHRRGGLAVTRPAADRRACVATEVGRITRRASRRRPVGGWAKAGRRSSVFFQRLRPASVQPPPSLRPASTQPPSSRRPAAVRPPYGLRRDARRPIQPPSRTRRSIHRWPPSPRAL